MTKRAPFRSASIPPDTTGGTRGGPGIRPVEVVADGYAVEHNDVDHNLARSGVADRVVPAADRSREDGLWAPGECRQGEQQQLPSVGDWYAGCTD